MNRGGQIARISPQTAMVLAFEAAILTMMVSRPLSLGLIAVLAGGIWLAGGGRRHGWVMGALLALGAWSVVFSQGLFYEGAPRTPLLMLLPGGVFPFGEPPGLYLYIEGLRHGLVQSLRFSAIVLLGASLLVRYSTDEMAGGLRALRLPAPLCFLFSMTLRFFPLIVAEGKTTWHAQHFRGYRLWPSVLSSLRPGFRPGRTRRLSPVRVLMLPLLAAQVRKADEIAAALHSRGYSPAHTAPAHAEQPRPTAASVGEMALCVLAAMLLLALGAALLTVRLEPGGLPSPWLERLISTVVRYV